jgi:NAD(P)H-dependent nitrite reductase small subunit
MTDFVTVAKTEDIPPGEGRTVVAAGRSIAIFNVDGTFRAVDNTCVHRGGPLGEGTLEDNLVTCPLHGWQYDLETGQNPHNPAAKVATYDVKVEDGEVKVRV